MEVNLASIQHSDVHPHHRGKICEPVFQNEMKSSLISSSQPQSVALGYLNDDHEIDMVVVNSGTDTIGILLSKGNGTFTEQQTYSTGLGSRPSSVVVNDFNNDNYSDIVVANYDNRTDIVVVNYGTNNIGILLGYRNGYFQNQTTYSTGYDSFPSSVAVADFNNDSYLDIVVANHVGDFNKDNKLDIVVANNGSGNISIFFGNGNASFQPQITYPVSSNSYPQYIAVGHLNTDDELDLIVIDSQHNQIHVLPGNRNGNFTTITTYDGISGSRPSCVAVTDVNRNNQSDIIVVNYGTSNVLVLIDYSAQLSVRQTNYDVESLRGSFSIAVSDFNTDQIIDVVYSKIGYISLRIGLGNGTFGIEVEYPIGTGNRAQYICVGDVNNDTKVDIVIAFIYYNSVGVLLGNGNGTFLTVMNYSTGTNSNPTWVALGDVNNDHRLDIVSANFGSNTVGIHLGNGDGTFRTMVNYSTGIGIQPYSVAIGDLNHDSYLDLVVATGNGYVVVFLGYGNGSFTILHVLSTLQNNLCFSVALGYLNNDTYLDIVVANTYDNSIGVFLGYKNATFGPQKRYSTDDVSLPYYVITADLNNDNISDIVATNLGNDHVIIFYGLGNGSFQIRLAHPTGLGSKPYSIAAADFDNNKQLDIAVAFAGNRHIAILTEYKAAVFFNQTKYSTGSSPQPYSVAIGDFNNDNRPDIVVANSGTDNVGILLALGNATFNMTMKYEIDGDFYPQYVITCDVDNDDQLDIVSVNSKTDSISVIRGYGNGTFAEQVIYSTGNGSHPVAAAAGDFNNDTRLDLVITNEGTDSLGIFFGFNYTIFQDQKTYSSVDILSPIAISVSDFNNDTYLDIAATFYSSNKIGILLGNSNGSFTSTKTYSTGNDSVPYGIAVDDLNNDGRSDIVVANSLTNTIGVFLGYGNRSFTDMKEYSTGNSSGPRSVAVGDVNNDNTLDIVVANYGSNSIGILFGYGNGNFSNVTRYPTGVGSMCWSVILGDFNNDDNLDIAVSNFGTHNVGVFFGYGNRLFRDQMFLTMIPSAGPMQLAIGDFNRDNQVDIAVADWNNGKIGIFIGHGNGTFDNMRIYSSGDGSLPIYTSVGDFNNDNISDIAVVNYGTNSIVVLFGLGDGSFLLGTSHSTGFGSQPYALAIGDFNNDTRLDIVVANYATNNIGVFLAYDYQPFGSVTQSLFYEGSKPHSVAVNDLNNDGCADIVIVNYGTDNLDMILGDGHGNFTRISRHSTGIGSAPSSVALAHFNNDIYLDIVVANSQTDSIAILLGYGNGTFVTGLNYSTSSGSYPYTVVTADFNNDNRTDIAVANYGTSNILLFYGHGNGTFENPISYLLGYSYHPSSLAVADFNQDNWLDIVIACYGTDHVETLIHICL